MMDVGLAAVANQDLFVQLEEQAFHIRVHAAGSGCMVVDIERNSEAVVTGQRIVPGTPLMPYRYEEETGGNFVLTTDAEELPDFEQFGITQFLTYVTAAELAAFRE